MATKMHKVTPLNPEVLDFPGRGKPIYPSMEIRQTDLPDIKDKKIGDEFYVKVKVRVSGLRERRAEEIYADADLLEIGIAQK